MPVWSSPSWWRMGDISTFLKPVASSSRWSTSPLMASSSPLCRRSASTHYNLQSYSSTQHRNIGNTHACKKIKFVNLLKISGFLHWLLKMCYDLNLTHNYRQTHLTKLSFHIEALNFSLAAKPSSNVFYCCLYKAFIQFWTIPSNLFQFINISGLSW